MTTFFWFKLYLLTVPVFFVIDMIWLGIVARGFYKEQLTEEERAKCVDVSQIVGTERW